MALKCLVLLVVLAAVVRAQLPGLGSCPDYKPIDSFDMKKFLGTWYENERYYSVFEVGTRCSRIEYMEAADGKFTAANTITSRITGITRVLNGEMKLANTANTKEGRLSIRYDQLPLSINSEYSVLATDYTDYAILWSCNTPVPYILISQNAWLMTRTPEISTAKMAEALAHFDRLGINRRLINKVDQTNCPPTVEAAATTAAPAATTAAPAATTQAATAAAPTAAPTAAPILRNNPPVQVKKAQVNTVEVEAKKPVAPAVSVVPAVVTIVKDEEVKIPEDVPEPAPEPEPTSASEAIKPMTEPIIPQPIVPMMPALITPAAIKPEPIIVSEPIKPIETDISEKVEIKEPARIIEDTRAH